MAAHPAVVRVLLRGAIDYAGLFPPASLEMAPAVANYAAYRASSDAWALGRFIVPATRLDEFEDAAGEHLSRPGREPWRLSVLASGALESNAERVREFNQHRGGGGAAVALIDAIELKAESDAQITRAVRMLPERIMCYVEVPVDRDPRRLVAAAAGVGAGAKVRTGGVTGALIPPAADVARFLAACAAEKVPCKATAGLHHPLRAEYRLTYEAGSAAGTMHGFLNVLLAAAFLRTGATEAEAAAVLEERDPAAFRFESDGVSWRALRAAVGDVERMRTESLRSFGSCSFREPIDELTALGLL